MFFFKSSATSSLNEANESSEDNNLTVPLISKSITFASTFLASDKCVRLLEAVRILGTSKLERFSFICLFNDLSDFSATLKALWENNKIFSKEEIDLVERQFINNRT
jgi:hypothetical protein